MRFVQYIEDGLTEAGIPFSCPQPGTFRIGERVSIYAEPRVVSLMTVTHKSPTRFDTVHNSVQFTGRKWRRDMILIVAWLLNLDEAAP